MRRSKRNPPSNLALVGIYMFGMASSGGQQHQAQLSGGWIADAIQWSTRATRCIPIHNGLDRHRQAHRPVGGQQPRVGRVDHRTGGYVDRDVSSTISSDRARRRVINSVVAGHYRRRLPHHQQLCRPFTSIYHDTVVEDSEIEHSIVLDHSRIVGIPSRIEDGIIGRRRITFSPSSPRPIR